MNSEKPDIPKVQKQPKSRKAELKELQCKIEALQKEKDEVFAKLQRVGADYDNLQKRTAKQIAEAISYEREQIIKSFLPVLDNLERTLQNAQSAANVNVLLEGVQMVYDQMLDILKSHNVEQIKAVGEPFDPALHDAMMPRTENEKEDNIVLEECQKGYMLNGRVIRHCKVIVNKLTREQPAEQAKDENETNDRDNRYADL
jgi:molecular chaperone GrpE